MTSSKWGKLKFAVRILDEVNASFFNTNFFIFFLVPLINFPDQDKCPSVGRCHWPRRVVSWPGGWLDG